MAFVCFWFFRIVLLLNQNKPNILILPNSLNSIYCLSTKTTQSMLFLLICLFFLILFFLICFPFNLETYFYFFEFSEISELIPLYFKKGFWISWISWISWILYFCFWFPSEIISKFWCFLILFFFVFFTFYILLSY